MNRKKRLLACKTAERLNAVYCKNGHCSQTFLVFLYFPKGICNSSNQKMESIYLLLDYGLVLWLVLVKTMGQKWQCASSKAKPKETFKLSLSLLETCPAAMWKFQANLLLDYTEKRWAVIVESICDKPVPGQPNSWSQECKWDQLKPE